MNDDASVESSLKEGVAAEGSTSREEATDEIGFGGAAESSGSENKEGIEGGGVIGGMTGTLEEFAVEKEADKEEDTPKNLINKHEAEYQEQREKRRAALQAQLLDKTKVPATYYSTSKKEGMVIQYVENFNRQYVQLYPGRKELLLLPENEFGIKKFVCTTIRPTKLPYKEIYDYRKCAKFVADYLAYEALEPPHELPKRLPSPTYTLKMQSGNCFDYSVLLVSLLRGFGYDAYVVSGYATRDITILDETKTESDAIGIASPAGGETSPNSSQTALDAPKPNDGDSSNSLNKYKVKPPRQLQSQFILRQEMKRKEKEKREQELKMKELERQRALMIEDDDELKGLRIHAWVLVLPGKREIAEAFFIEPTTGLIYSTENENYLGVESLFSANNYWVNMQVCYDGLKGIEFDLGDNSKWEFVLLDNTQPGVSSKPNADKLAEKENSDDEDEDDTKNLEILDLPPSWVDKLQITKEQYESKCPSGSKTVIYRNARVETFAEYHRTDGMVSRITFFADELKNFNGEIRETFFNRRDKLVQRIQTPDVGKIQEFFDPGRQHGLKEHIIVEGKTTEMHFYPSARSDGLMKRVEQANKVIEYFIDREDRLTYRSVTYEPVDDAGLERTRDPNYISKMTEKFNRNKEVPAHQDPAKITYYVKEEKNKVVYHLEEDRIISSYREFRKPNTEHKSLNLDMPSNFEVNPYLKTPKKQHLFAQLFNLVRSEQAFFQSVKNSEREISEILQARIMEEKDVILLISVYDTIRNNTRVAAEEEKETHKSIDEDSKGADLDYLSPFLVHVNQKKLSPAEAAVVKEACLKSLKERVVEKANIIQSKLEEATSEYQRRQLAYSRNADSMSAEETDEYVKFCNDALFKIHILEKRLAKHKESAPERYIQLDAKLRADPRLAQ